MSVRVLARLVCLLRDHRWRVLRSIPDCHYSFSHVHPLFAVDADCERCGAEWRDVDAHAQLHASLGWRACLIVDVLPEGAQGPYRVRVAEPRA